MSEDIERYLQNHNILKMDNYLGYHQCLVLYYLYLADCMDMAEQIEDGEVHDELEVSILLVTLQTSRAAVDYYKEQLGLKFVSYDVSEQISFEGCTLEKGKFVGDVNIAKKIARMWMRDFSRYGEDLLYFRKDKNGLDKNSRFFCYEVAVFICILLGMDVHLEKCRRV